MSSKIESYNTSPVIAGKKDLSDQQEQDCRLTYKLFCFNPVLFVKGYPQKKGESQLLLSLSKNKVCERCFMCRSLEFCKSCHKCPAVAVYLPVGATLHQFWEKWAAVGVSPKVVTVLREGYTLPFWFRPNLIRSPTVINCCVNPHKNLYLLEALHQLVNKNAVELVATKKTLGFTTDYFQYQNPTTCGDLSWT